MTKADDAQLYANAYFAVAATGCPGSTDVYTMLRLQGEVWSDERFGEAESAFYRSHDAYAAYQDQAEKLAPGSTGVKRVDLSKLRAAVWDKTGGDCWHCGIQMNPFRDFTIDHLQPLAKGGTDEPDNLVPCCRRCNNSKGAR